MKLTRMLACLLCVLLLGGCATETAAVEETVVPETQAGSGDPAQSTCKSSYTGQPDPEAVVAVCAGRELTAAQLQAWYWAEITHFCQQEPETAPDFALPLESQSCGLEDGCTWQQYFLKQALNRWHSAAALMEQAEQEGRPLEAAYMPDRDKYAEYMEGMPATKFLYGYSESYQPNTMHQRYLDQIPVLLDTLAREQGYSGVDAMAEDAFGTSAQALEDFVYQYNYAYMFFTTLSYDVEPEEGAVESWLAEHAGSYSQTATLVDIRHILLVPDASEDMEKAWTDCERQAQKLLTQWKRELWVTEATFAELATEHSQDTGTAADGGLYRRIHPGQLLPELDSWCFSESRQEGDTAIFRSEAGCHIVYFAGRVEAAYEAAEEDYLAWQQKALIAAARERYPMEVDYSAVTLGQVRGGIGFGDVLYPDIAHERFPEVPLYLQQDYPKTSYGEYRITKNGCGITSLAMVASYLSDNEWTPPELCARYGRYSHANGTDGMIFINEAAVLGFYFKEKTHDVSRVWELLEDGYLVVSLQHSGYWTSGGHYIVLERITENGRVQVRDSNLMNYRKIESHAQDSHSWNSIRNRGAGYWVFEKKVTAIPACSRCGDGTSGSSILREEYLCEKCAPALLRRQVYLDDACVSP